MEKRRRSAAELLVACLEQEGVTHMFGVPGEENLAFLEALRTSSIRFIVTRHEQAAVFMATTLGRLTGKVSVALSTLGPGATNLMTGVAYAQLGGMPLMVITGQKPARKSKQGRFQIIDAVRMMEPVTKLSRSITSADRVPFLVHEAIAVAERERPGAVHLELPEDIAEEETEATPIVSEKVRRAIPSPKAVDIALELIQSAKSPLLIVGAGANRKRIRKQLARFIEKTNIPFVTTQMGKGVVDETSKHYIGTTALTSGDYVHKAIDRSDCLIVLGHDTSEKPPALFSAERQKIIHINFYPADIDTVYVPDQEIVGDVSHALWEMTEKVSTQAWDFSYFHKVREALMANIGRDSGRGEFPLAPERIVADIGRALPADGTLSLDNGMYKLWIARNHAAKEQNSVLLDNALATMGAGLPAGMAAKLLDPEKKVLVVAGDGGFMMTLPDLETAVRLNLDIVVLILNDSGYGMIKWKQKEMGFDDFALSFGNPDFVKLAESFGAHGRDITSADELLPALTETLEKKGVHIINCPVDYSRNSEALGSALKKELETI